MTQAAETAVREVVGQMRMDMALSEERDQIAPRIRAIMQKILDRYKVGIEVVGINLQQGGVRPPEQVQAAFDDVLKAGQERERAKNEAEAYANDVIPRAVGTASRLKEEAEGYKSRIVAQAQGDAQRFKSLLTEYQKAPQVTRDRMYIDAMQQMYSNVTKVMVESKQGSNLLYLPLDKIIVHPPSVEKLRWMINQPYGIIYVTGPTGSGKATTLHAVLGHLNKPERKIWTAEDPVEITQKGLRQVQVNKKAGLDFAAVMKAFLRADPDIIMVGEMRDKETTGTGIEASLTGHLVFSTLHTNDAPSSITRLIDMGVAPFLVASSVMAIMDGPETFHRGRRGRPAERRAPLGRLHRRGAEAVVVVFVDY